MHESHATEESRRNYITIAEAARQIGCGRSKAQMYLATLNKELKAKGYLVAPGRVPRRYFFEQMGLEEA